MKQEMQHWLSRNRPPRVQITYDVETLGATVKQEIPFIAGIIGDFAGSPQEATIADRSFVEIDRDNFGNVMKSLAPSVTVRNGEKPFAVVRSPKGTTVEQNASAPAATPTFAFTSMDDFAPPAIIGQVPGLKKLMDTRQNLSDLMAQLGTDPSLEPALISAAAAPALVPAGTAVAQANKALTDATNGALALFKAAATDVLAVETAEPNKTTVTTAQATVTTLVGDANGGYTQAFAAVPATGATAAQLAAAGSAGWAVTAALKSGSALLAGITAGYDATLDVQKKAIASVALAAGAVDAAAAPAWQAQLYGGSAQAVAKPSAS